MKIHVKSTVGGLSQTITDVLVELNRGVWHANLNQGNPGSPGLSCELPDKVDFQIELIAENGANALQRTTSKVQPEARTTSVQTEGEKVTYQSQNSQTQSQSDASSSGTVSNTRGGTDRADETLTYGET